MRFSIGQLGKATDTKVETIRYYERIGLMPKPVRTSGNYRAYSSAERDRLVFIRRARDLGFSIGQVRALLELAEGRDQSCATVDALAETHLADIERKISDLQAMRSELSALIARCDADTIADCRIIEAIALR